MIGDIKDKTFVNNPTGTWVVSSWHFQVISICQRYFTILFRHVGIYQRRLNMGNIVKLRTLSRASVFGDVSIGILGVNLVPKWGMGLYSRASQFSEIFQKFRGGTLLEGGILHASVRYMNTHRFRTDLGPTLDRELLTKITSVC